MRDELFHFRGGLTQYRPMKEHHICFSAKGDQWEKSFLISGDRGGAEDDAEHICEHGGGAGQVPGSLREGGLFQLHVQLCPPLLTCPASKLLINNHVILKGFLLKFAFFICCKHLKLPVFSTWKVISEIDNFSAASFGFLSGNKPWLCAHSHLAELWPIEWYCRLRTQVPFWQ